MFAVFSGVFSVFNLVVLFYYSRFLAAIALGVVAVAVSVTTLLGFFRIRYTRSLATLEGRMQALVLQLIKGTARFRTAGAENRAFHLWAGLFAEKKRVEFRAHTVNSIMSVFNGNYPVAASMVIFVMVLYSYKKALLLASVTGLPPASSRDLSRATPCSR
jgi:ATP-binding cassette subfamily C protein